MPIAAAHVEGRRRQVDVPIEARLHRPQQGAEVGQVAEVEPEVIFEDWRLVLSLVEGLEACPESKRRIRDWRSRAEDGFYHEVI
jgi:hypothetical protein